MKRKIRDCFSPLFLEKSKINLRPNWGIGPQLSQVEIIWIEMHSLFNIRIVSSILKVWSFPQDQIEIKLLNHKNKILLFLIYLEDSKSVMSVRNNQSYTLMLLNKE